jgi:hypothetical protein
MKVREYTPKEYLYINADFAYDLKTNRCYTYMFNKGKYLRNVGKKVQGLINLMRRKKPKGIILTAIKQQMEKGISLHKLSKLFEKINGVYKIALTKGPVPIEVSPTHEVKRVSAICPLVEQSYYKEGHVKAALYFSRSTEAASIVKVKR